MVSEFPQQRVLSTIVLAVDTYTVRSEVCRMRGEDTARPIKYPFPSAIEDTRCSSRTRSPPTAHTSSDTCPKIRGPVRRSAVPQRAGCLADLQPVANTRTTHRFAVRPGIGEPARRTNTDSVPTDQITRLPSVSTRGRPRVVRSTSEAITLPAESREGQHPRVAPGRRTFAIGAVELPGAVPGLGLVRRPRRH